MKGESYIERMNEHDFKATSTIALGTFCVVGILGFAVFRVLEIPIYSGLTCAIIVLCKYLYWKYL